MDVLGMQPLDAEPESYTRSLSRVAIGETLESLKDVIFSQCDLCVSNFINISLENLCIAYIYHYQIDITIKSER